MGPENETKVLGTYVYNMSMLFVHMYVCVCINVSECVHRPKMYTDVFKVLINYPLIKR